MNESTQLHYLPAPPREEIPATAVEFLAWLPGPAHIYLPGRDSSRCRAVVTLLHGNEPSGLTAIHALLRQGVEPAVDVHFFIPSVIAARAEPMFYHRMLPGERDLNRCFKAPFDNNSQSQLAKLILDKLFELKPEALIDVHNTSGVGPSFGVVTFMDERHEALVSLFSHRLVVTDLELGSVMELSNKLCPTVTIECGGAKDEESNRMALIGMTQFLGLQDVLSFKPADIAMDFFHHPVRLEVQDDVSIAYNTAPVPNIDITLLPEIEHLNFNYVEPHTLLGFVNGELSQLLRANTTSGEDRLQKYFSVDNGQLTTRLRMKVFMVTNNAEIARTDCVLYFVAG